MKITASDYKKGRAATRSTSTRAVDKRYDMREQLVHACCAYVLPMLLQLTVRAYIAHSNPRDGALLCVLANCTSIAC